jgi:hypothetical protein
MPVAVSSVVPVLYCIQIAQQSITALPILISIALDFA